MKAAARIPLETERAATAEWPGHLRLASRHRAAILSDIITNENLKLLQINYLARKVDVLFNFPSRSHCTCNRIYGKTMHNAAPKVFCLMLMNFSNEKFDEQWLVLH